MRRASKDVYVQKIDDRCAAVAALAFGLAACGGGGSDTPTASTPTTPTEPAGPTEPASPTAQSLKAESADATTDAQDAGKAATQAKADAIKYAGMLTAEDVEGDSSKAIENAGRFWLRRRLRTRQSWMRTMR